MQMFLNKTQNDTCDDEPLIQKLGAIHQPKSLWDFKSEINSLPFTNFTMLKIISL